MILVSNPREQYLSHKRAINKAIEKVLNSGIYINGPELQRFEDEFSAYIGVKYSIGVGNCTSGLQLALMALELQEGDEVITVSHTVSCTVSAIIAAKCTPVLVDVHPTFYTIDTNEIKKAISEKTKAIIPVHLYGNVANMKEILAIAKEYNLKVVEDCAQAVGAECGGVKVGSFGHISCFSFYPTKNLGCFGDGGMVVTSNPILNKRLRYLSEVGWTRKYFSVYNGINSRLDELQAAILRVKLKYLDEDNNSRIKIAEKYNKDLLNRSFILPKTSDGIKHVYHQYVIQSNRRDELINYLRSQGIIASVHYPIAVHQQPIYKKLKSGSLITTNLLVKNILSLPIYPELSNSDVKYIISSLKRFEDEK